MHKITPYIYIKSIQRGLVWLSRIGHCRGFGVQSPTDYRFVCNVINDKRPYEEYRTLLTKHPTDDADKLKLLRLYFRLARHFKPSAYIDFTSSYTVGSEYVRTGSPDVDIICAQDHSESDVLKALQSSDSEAVLMRISLKETTLDGILSLIGKCGRHSVVVFEDIKGSKTNRTMWQSIAKSPHAIITFDLYYCGIAFFDTSRYKQNYIINF